MAGSIIFNDILNRGIRQGKIPARTQDARDWFRKKARQTRSSQAYPRSIMSSAERKKARLGPGRMVHFFYDPKTKDKLPYYDTFPLIFFVGPAENGFYGINLHYLPPSLRANLMDALYDAANNKKYDDSTRIIISYGILKNASKYRYFKPCFKHYLNNHVKSNFIQIDAVEWDIALFLPTERFIKASRARVFRDSRRAV